MKNDNKYNNCNNNYYCTTATATTKFPELFQVRLHISKSELFGITEAGLFTGQMPSSHPATEG